MNIFSYINNISQNFVNINYKLMPVKDQMENTHVLVYLIFVNSSEQLRN